MELDTFTIGLLGTIGTTLVGVVGVLWRENVSLRKEKDSMHKEMRETLEKVLREFHNVTGNSTLAISSFKELILRMLKDG